MLKRWLRILFSPITKLVRAFFSPITELKERSDKFLMQLDVMAYFGMFVVHWIERYNRGVVIAFLLLMGLAAFFKPIPEHWAWNTIYLVFILFASGKYGLRQLEALEFKDKYQEKIKESETREKQAKDWAYKLRNEKERAENDLEKAQQALAEQRSDKRRLIREKYQLETYIKELQEMTSRLPMYDLNLKEGERAIELDNIEHH